MVYIISVLLIRLNCFGFDSKYSIVRPSNSYKICYKNVNVGLLVRIRPLIFATSFVLANKRHNYVFALVPLSQSELTELKRVIQLFLILTIYSLFIVR